MVGGQAAASESGPPTFGIFKLSVIGDGTSRVGARVGMGGAPPTVVSASATSSPFTGKFRVGDITPTVVARDGTVDTTG